MSIEEPIPAIEIDLPPKKPTKVYCRRYNKKLKKVADLQLRTVLQKKRYLRGLVFPGEKRTEVIGSLKVRGFTDYVLLEHGPHDLILDFECFSGLPIPKRT